MKVPSFEEFPSVQMFGQEAYPLTVLLSSYTRKSNPCKTVWAGRSIDLFAFEIAYPLAIAGKATQVLHHHFAEPVLPPVSEVRGCFVSQSQATALFERFSDRIVMKG